MNQLKSHLTDSIRTLAEAALIELPAAIALRIFKVEEHQGLEEAGWRAYQAANEVVTNLSDRVYGNRKVISAGVSMIERARKTQDVADAYVGAFLAVLWPSLGLPTADDIETLRRDVKALREEVRTAAFAPEAIAAEPDVREAALGARMHPEFDNPMWVRWHEMPAFEVRNRVRP
jgi:hypothetical protein